MIIDKGGGGGGGDRDMSADHFEALGTHLAGMGFDDNFCARITNRVKEMSEICVEDPSGVLNERRSSRGVFQISGGFRCPHRL